jgi:hypothetical protein
MAFTGSFICNSFKLELLLGVHNFGPSGNSFRLALYTEDATLDADTTSYIGTTDEVAPSGTYGPGGGFLTLQQGPQVVNGVACLRWNGLVFSSATISARGALIYNDSLPGKNAVAVIDFGSVRNSVVSDFTVTFPSILPDPTNAIIRVI